MTTRLDGGPGAIYELTGTTWDDSRHTYLGALRLFRNFRYPAEALDEAPPDEALDVLIRQQTTGRTPEESRSTFERESVLTLPSMPWFLEWIDVIEPTDAGPIAPLLVFADPHAGLLTTVVEADPGARVVLACEVLAMIDALHHSGMAVGAMGPVDFLYSGPGRWSYLGTDRIREARGASDVRDDLSHWALLTDELLRGGASEWWPREPLPGRFKEQSLWLFERVRLCLEGDPSGRPGTVAGLERGPSGGRGLIAGLRGAFGRHRDGR